MKRLFAIALALFVCSGTAWAGPVTWSYDFTPSSNFLLGNGGTNQVDFTNQGSVTTVGSTDIVATNMSIHNNASDTFTNKEYLLQMVLTDGANSTTLNFKGLMNGTITNGSPTLLNTFESPLTQTATLGLDTFTVTMNSFTSPNPFNADPTKVTKGAIGFHVDVNGGEPPPPPPPTNDVPEPSTMLLGCFGVVGMAYRAWKMRKA